jgi:outer membrane protein assembly factor BamB
MTTIVLFLAAQSDLWQMDSEKAVDKVIERMRQSLDERRSACQSLIVLQLIRPEVAEAIRARIKTEEDGRVRARLEWVLEQNQWKAERDYAAPPLEDYVLHGDLFIGRPQNGAVSGYSLKTGQQIWTSVQDRFCMTAPIGVGPEHVLVWTNNNVIQCLEAKTGKLCWNAAAPYTGERPMICAGAWIHRRDGLSAHDLKSGRVRWNLQVSPRTVTPGVKRLFVTDDAKGLTALDPETGKAVWTAELPFLGATIVSGGSRVYAIVAGTIVAYDEAVGQKLWTMGETGTLPDCVSATEEAMFAVDTSQNLHCIDPVRGKILWTKPRESGVTNEWRRRPAVVMGPVVFVNLPQGGLSVARFDNGEAIKGIEGIQKGWVFGRQGPHVIVWENLRLLYYRLQ